MNREKLLKLQAQVRIGGKGTPRRKKKVIHRTATADDKKLQSSLKKLSVNNIPGIEEVNMIKDDGSVIHFNNPKVQASLSANTFAVTGHAEEKQITEMLPSILNQLGAESLTHLKRLTSNVTAGGKGNAEQGDDEEVPLLVENFDEPSKKEASSGGGENAHTEEDDEDVPELVENFDEPSKNEVSKVVKFEDVEDGKPTEVNEEAAKSVESKEDVKIEEVSSEVKEEASTEKVEKTAEATEEKPIEATEDSKVEKPIEATEDSTVEKPIEVTEDSKVEKPIEVTEDSKVEKPIEATEDSKVEKPIEATEDSKVEKPVEATEDSKVEKVDEPPVTDDTNVEEINNDKQDVSEVKKEE